MPQKWTSTERRMLAERLSAEYAGGATLRTLASTHQIAYTTVWHLVRSVMVTRPRGWHVKPQ